MKSDPTKINLDWYDYDVEEELIIQKLISKLNKLWITIWSKKFWIIGWAMVASSLFFTKAIFENPTYEAILTFMVEEEEGRGIGNIASVLGQFGLGGGAGKDQNLEKITSLTRTRKILHPVLLERMVVDGKLDFIANHIINIYELQDNWKKDTLLSEFYFVNDDFSSFSKKENLALNIVYNLVAGNEKKGTKGLLKSGFSIETNFLFINITAINESLAIKMTESIYEKLSAFYIEESIKNPKQTFDILVQRTDSILVELTNTQKKLAYLEAKNTARVTHDDRIRKKILSRDLQILSIMYGEVLKTKETSDFILKNETPFFQTIDEPFSPITPEESSKLLALLLGGILGGFLSTAFFISKEIYYSKFKKQLVQQEMVDIELPKKKYPASKNGVLTS